MKKYLLLLCPWLFVSTSHAQVTNLGIKAGINMASVEISGATDYDTRLGLHLGALAHVHISKRLAIQPEVVFSMQGGESGSVTLKLNYLNIPVLVQYMVNDGFRVETGPQIGFLLSAKSKMGEVEVDVDDEISSIDLSWVFGVGYLFPQGLGIDTRINIGINNISDIDAFKAHNQVFQVGLFYQFKHKNKHK